MMGAFDCVNAKITPTESTEVFTVHTASNYTLNEPSRDVESQAKTRSCTSGRNLCWTLGVDVPLFVLVLALIGLFEVGVIRGRKAGFYCNDPALSFPDRGETVTSGMLMAIVFILPLVVFFITELVFTSSETTKQTLLLATIKSVSWLYRSYLFGLIMNLCVVEVMKGIFGGARPVFFDVCAPDTARTCNGSDYVRTFECTSTRFSWWDQMDSYRSFPSGHTSLSMYCALFVSWYLQKRAFDWRHRTVLVVPAVQLACLSTAALSSLSRVTDRRHHWWDVLAGAALALLALFYAVIFLCNSFTQRAEPEESENSRKSTSSLLFQEQPVIR